MPRNHSTDTTKVTAFPDGLRMLAGNPFKRSYDGSPTAEAIGWNCLGSNVKETRQPYLPPYNCPNGMRGVRLPTSVGDFAMLLTGIPTLCRRSGSRLAGTASTWTPQTISRTWLTPRAASLAVSDHCLTFAAEAPS